MFNTTAYGKAVVKYTGGQKPGFSDFRLLPISGFVDMWKTFPDIFQDFNFEILKSQHVLKTYTMSV